MANAKDLTPIVPQVGKRTSNVVNIAAMNDINANGSAYPLVAGETFVAPPYDDINAKGLLREVQVREGSNAKFYLLQGKKRDASGAEVDYFMNLNTLLKRDVNRDIVNPTWEDQSWDSILKSLCKMGEIKVLEMRKILVPVFDRETGRPESTIDANNVSHYVTREQTVPVYTPRA